MENASKALLIAGAVLIAVMLLGLAVYVIRGAKQVKAEYEDTMSEQYIMQFNQEILKKLNFDFEKEKYIAKPQQLVSLKNFIEEKGNGQVECNASEIIRK